MRRICVFIAFLFSSLAVFSQTGTVQGFCNQGGKPAVTSGLNSANNLQGIIPGCTVTVYLHGSTTLATLYKDGNNTPLSNPFTANLAGTTNAGGWLFFSSTNQGVDIMGSGGNGNPSCSTSPTCYASSTPLGVAVYPSGSTTPVSGVVSFSGDGVLLNNSASTGAVTASLAQAAAYKVFGNCTSGSTLPSYCSLVYAMFPSSGVTAGSYTNVNVTVNAQGIITAIANGSSGALTLTTTGTSGAATLTGSTLNIPQYQCALTLTTAGSSGAATLSGCTLNIPQYSGGGGSGYTNVTGSASETTVSAINSACGSGTFYATTPLSIATGGTVSCPVQFSKAGEWTIASGQTVTFSDPITQTDTPSQIFAGSGTAVLAVTQTEDYPEWWGAINDWNGSTGTDNTTLIQAAVNALTNGTVWLAPGDCYKITSALSVTKSNLSIQGKQIGGYVVPYGIGSSVSPSSCLVSTSASADFVDVAGASTGARLTNNVIKNIALQRTLAPTGTAAGFNFQYTCGAIVDYTTSSDSIYNYYLKGTSSCGTGGFFHSLGSHGYSGFTYSGGPYYDWYLDTSGGVTMNTVILDYAGGAENGITNTYCAALYGSENVDENLLNLNCYREDYGVDLNTSSGGTTRDVHIDNPTLDGMNTTAVRVTESGGSREPVTISGGDGWMNTVSTGTYGVDCESANDLTITGVQFWWAGWTGNAASVYLNGCSNVVVSNNLMYPHPSANGVWLNNTNYSAIVGNTVDGGSGTGFVFHGSSNNTLQGNTVSAAQGVINDGVSFDSGSDNNTASQLNSLSAATTPISDSGTGNSLTATATVNVNGSSVSNPNFNGTTPSAPAGTINNTYQASGSSVSNYTPAATASTPGVIKPDGTTCTVTSGVLTCTGSAGATSIPICTPASASGTAYTCTTSPSFVPVAGSVIAFKPDVSNSGTSATLNVNSSAADPIAKWQNVTTLAANDFRASTYTVMTFDGTNWEGQTIGNAPSAASVTPAAPYIEIGSTFYDSEMYAVTKPTACASISWIGGTAPATCTTGANGNVAASSTSASSQYWQKQSMSSSIDMDFRVGCGGSNASNTCTAGPYVYDSTNSLVWTMVVGNSGTQVSIQINTYSYSGGSSLPTSGANKITAYNPTLLGPNAHFSISVSGSTLTFAVTTDGGITYQALATACSSGCTITSSIGTIAAGGFTLFDGGASDYLSSINVFSEKAS